MNATTTTTVTRFVLVAEPVKGETYRVTVTTKTGEETFTARFRGTASTGLRFVNADGKVITRAPSKIVKIEAEETHEVPADEPPAEFAAAPEGEVTVFAELAPVEITEDAAVAEIRAAAEAPVEVTVIGGEESSETAQDVFDADPMVGGKRLSEMRFAEVMKLAQHYKTPGRGVARIAALRAGVAKAIAEEVGRLVGAAS